MLVEGQGGGHAVVRVLTLPPISAGRLHLVWVSVKHGKSVIGGARRAARFFGPGQKMATTARGRRLVPSLPSHLQRRQWSGMAEAVLQDRGNEHGSQLSPPEWE